MSGAHPGTGTLIRSAQRNWAASRGIEFDSFDRVRRLEDNLFQALHPESRREFEQGDGSELGSEGSPGSMYSLISSSALCCNLFDAWRGRPLANLGEILGIGGSYVLHRFESKHQTGLAGNSPNLDVELIASGLKPVAVESKFVEPYRRARNSFRPSYFSPRADWAGLDSWKRVALAVARGDLSFPTLHVAQLIKHVLGLSRRYGPDGFTLLYLWYRVPGTAGDEHQAEIDRFRECVGQTVDFRAATYLEVLSRVGEGGPPGWREYMHKRYSLGSTLQLNSS